MRRFFNAGSWRGALTAALLCLAALGLLLYPGEAAEGGRQGLALCLERVIPSLFPFFVLSSLATALGLAERLGQRLAGLMGRVFHVSGAAALPLAVGLLSGSPAGARCCAELCAAGMLDREEAERLLGFCANLSPGFIVGMAGAGIFGDGLVGLYLWGVHVFSSLLFGVLLGLRRRGADSPRGQVRRRSVPAPSPLRAFPEAVAGAGSAVLTVCAFVVLFSVLLAVLEACGALEGLAGLLPLPEGQAAAAVRGLLETTAGVSALTAAGGKSALVLCAFLLGFSGLSVLCQILAVLGESGLSPRCLLPGKLFQAGVSAGVVFLTGDLVLPRVRAAFLPLRGAMPSGLSPAFSAMLVGLLFLWVALVALLARPGK